MDSKYPNLARPRKKLRYFSNRASASTTKGYVELDIDDSSTWFKDLDSPSDVGEELPPLSPPPTFATVEKENKTANAVEQVEKTGNPVEKVEREPSSVPETGEAVPQGEEMHKEGTAESTLLDTESPFKKHAPIKTSSPIKRQERDEDKDRTASPLLLICDDDDDHGPVKQPITALTPQCNGQAADGGYDAVLDSPPCRFSLSKQKTPVHSMPKKEETPCPRKALASPVREAPLTDLEDDFLILEDDGPSCFSLRWKTDPNRATPRPQQKDQSYSSNDASADTLTKASQSEKDTAKLRSEGTADVKTKEKNATGGSSLIPVLTKSLARKKRDSSPQGDGPVEADHIEQDQKKKVNNPLSEPTTAGDLEPGGGAKPKPSQSKSRTKTEKKVPRISKFQGYKVNPKTSRGRGRQSGKTMRLSAGAGQEPVVMEEECEAAADQDVSPVLQLAPSGQRRVKVPANRKAKEVGPSPTGEADSSQAGQLTQLAGKRKRIKPGPWWLNSPVNTQVTETDDTHTANKSKHNKQKTKPARYSPVESGQEEGTSRPLFNQNAKKKPWSNQTTENKPWSNQTAEHKAEKPKRVRPKKQKTTSREEPARPEGQREEEEDEASTAEQQEEQQEMGGLSPMPSPLRQHTLTPSEKVFDWIYTRSPKCKPQSDITPHSATVTPSRSDAFPTTVTPSRQWHQAREAPEKRRRRKAPWNSLKGFKSGPSSMIELEDYEENDDFCVRSFRVTPHPSVHQSVPPGIVLSVPEAVTELCAPPLRAIPLQLEDKANFTEWMALLWPATGKQGGQISPDHFQWFSYRDRALGYKMDLLAETFSNGTILLGSYMKKPLLVDHGASTVFNLLTSSVSVTINGKENHYDPGQTFMVPCGHAYSLHNLTQEPAALLFTRMLAESSE
ncbi:centromere protein C isoform X5 [Salvelinus alpinus]|uniref:centromere protein C isoform X5 n=1 Tax=Salvelinus alpinus TaxID=8036 RepID=UPI0039FBB1B4